MTLIAPSKTFNLAGMSCSVIICQNEEIRKRIHENMWGIGIHGHIWVFTAATAAYRDGHDWLAQLCDYLTDNRDYALDYIRQHIPNVKTTIPEATYLLWMDMRDSGIEDPHTFCREEAKLIFNNGLFFGKLGERFVRMNFGTSRARLREGLARLRGAFEQLG